VQYQIAETVTIKKPKTNPNNKIQQEKQIRRRCEQQLKHNHNPNKNALKLKNI
jgi:hypothetical protein